MLVFASNAQTKKYLFTHFNQKEGFKAKEALGIAQSKNGIIWIASNDGLAKYDSKSFKFFYHHSNDTTSISNNYCKALTIDKRQKLWLISDDDLDVFDIKTEKCQHIKKSKSEKYHEPIRPTTLTYDSSRDIVWIGTRSGLYYCEKGALPLKSIAAITKDSLLINQKISSVAQDFPYLWITAGTHIIKLHTQTGSTQITNLPKIIDKIDNGGDAGNILCSYMDNEKNLWLGTWCKGIIQYNTPTKIFHQYVYGNFRTQENSVPKITQTNIKGQEYTLWVSCYGNGLATFDIKTKKFDFYTAITNGNPEGVKGNGYHVYYSNNILWIGGTSGLSNIDFNKQIFDKYSLESIANKKTLLPIADFAIERSATVTDSMLWLYIPYHDAYRYDLISNKILKIPSKIKAYVNGHLEFMGWYIDNSNTLWLSTIENGLIGYNISKDSIVYQPNQSFNKTWTWIRTYHEDEKYIYLGTYKGLFAINKENYQIKEIKKVNEYLHKNKLAEAIISIAEDEQKNLWMTVDHSDNKNACILKYLPTKDTVVQLYDERTESNPSNPNVELRSIIADQKGKIYAVFFNEHIQWCPSSATSTKQWNYLNDKFYVINTYIDYLDKDKDGNIWASNVFGLSKMDLSNNIFIDYNFSNYGLGEANNPCLYISPNSGKLYLGLSNAFCTINPQQSQLTKPNFIINYLKVNDTIIATNIKNKTVFELKYDQNNIDVDCAILSYTNSHQNKYTWLLEGHDKQWQSNTTNRISYSNLATGNYTLTLKAAGCDGAWCEPHQLIFHISPPFYKTWWFILAGIVSLAGTAYYLVQLRIKRLKEKFELRNKIASDLHDEIGSTLTSISILSKVSLQALEKQPDQTKNLLQQIANQSKTIQQNMSDIVWSIRPDNDKVEDLIVRMREYAANTLESENITTTIMIDEAISLKSMSISYRKDILLIYKEAINNISKHAKATEVQVRLTNGNKQLQMLIHDNGTWKGNFAGTGTKSMQERAKTLGGQLEILPSTTGTIVKLNIPIP